MPSRTAIYIRVSTQEQAMEGYSIQAQTEHLQAYCKAKGWGIFHIYTDAGFSGSNMERPARQRPGTASSRPHAGPRRGRRAEEVPPAHPRRPQPAGHLPRLPAQPGKRLRRQTEDGNVIHVDFTKQK